MDRTLVPLFLTHINMERDSMEQLKETLIAKINDLLTGLTDSQVEYTYYLLESLFCETAD